MISLRNATVLFALAGLLALPVSWAQTSDSAARSYDEGLMLEKRGDEMGAFQSFLAAGEAGHGLAQKKLGEIYDDKHGPVERDYQSSLRWYEKARAQGVPIPAPQVQMPR
jgi:TPR repeat protein